MEIGGNYDEIGVQLPPWGFERRVISAVKAGDMSVETQLDFLADHHMPRNANTVVLPSFLSYCHLMHTCPHPLFVLGSNQPIIL